jgi:DNA-binding transcriptional LysR family regulator
VRHLAALAAVAHEGSFRRAADRLGYVQSAISGQIAHLERAAGTRLVERASGIPTVELTDAGRVLLSHTSEIMTRLEEAYVGVSSLAARTAASVRIAGLERFAPHRLARVLRAFRERHPSARIALEESTSDELSLELLAEGTLDLVVTDLPLPDGPFTHVVLEHDTHVLLVAADSELAVSGKPVGPRELASLRPIVPGSGRAAAALRSRLAELGVDQQAPLSPNSVATTQALVARGLGTAVLPRRLVDDNDPKTTIVDLPGLLPESTVVVVVHSEREHSPAVYGFVRAATIVYKPEAAAGDGAVARRPRGTPNHKLHSVQELVPDRTSLNSGSPPESPPAERASAAR